MIVATTGERRPQICMIHRGRLDGPTGFTTRVNAVVTALAEVADLDVVRVFSGRTTDLYVIGEPRIRRSIHVRAGGGRRAPWVRLLAPLRLDRPVRVAKIKASSERRAIAAALQQRYDMVWCVEPSAVPLAGAARAQHTVVDLNDYTAGIDQAILDHRDPGGRSWATRWARLDVWRYQRYVRRITRQADLTVVSSPIDADAAPGHVVVLPNAYPDQGALDGGTDRSHPPVVLMPGLFRYFPNEDAAAWFAREAWPLVRRLRPDARLRLAGRASPAVEALAELPGVEVAGPVASMADEVRRAGVVVAPLRFASGTRIKILEAWSLGTPVVSTTMGAAGLGAVDGTHLLLADTPQALADAVARLLDDRDLGDRLIAAGRARYEAAFTFEHLTRQVAGLVTGVLDGRTAHR